VFASLTNMGFKRSFKQAVGFYITYSIFGVVIVTLLGSVFIFASGDTPFERGQNGGFIVTILYSLFMAILVARSKGILFKADSVFLIFAGGFMGWLFGLFIGLVPVAILTTKANSHNKSFNQNRE